MPMRKRHVKKAMNSVHDVTFEHKTQTAYNPHPPPSKKKIPYFIIYTSDLGLKMLDAGFEHTPQRVFKCSTLPTELWSLVS